MTAVRSAQSRSSAVCGHAPTIERRSKYGILERKERWGLTWLGWILVLITLLLAGMTFFLGIYPFLAVTNRVDSDVLVVEGWIQNYAVRAAGREFTAGSYKHVYTTGGPVVGEGGYINDYNTTASITAGRLRAGGLPDEAVQMVPSRVMSRDRTYASAVALRDWFRGQKMSIHRLNVLTENTHARRTRLLFQEALGADVTVGIIAVPNPDYDAKHWWRNSQSVRDVMDEAFAYVYVKLFFHPGTRDQQRKGNSSEASMN